MGAGGPCVCARAHSHTDDSGTPWKPSRAARELGCEGGGAGEAWRGQWTVKPRWSRACARPRLVQGGQTRGREPGGCVSMRLSYSRAKRSCRHVRGGRVATLGGGTRSRTQESRWAVCGPCPGTAHRGAQGSHPEGRSLGLLWRDLELGSLSAGRPRASR